MFEYTIVKTIMHNYGCRFMSLRCIAVYDVNQLKVITLSKYDNLILTFYCDYLFKNKKIKEITFSALWFNIITTKLNNQHIYKRHKNE